jgi:branched-chain amino acid transport system substrate-binding protein
MSKNFSVKLLTILLGMVFLCQPLPAVTAGKNPPDVQVKAYLPLIWKPLNLSAPIKIGVLLPLSGPVAWMGQSALNGINLAIDEWKARHVISPGFTLVVEDGQCNSTVAVTAANKLIDQDQVRYILGEVCSGASMPVAEIANAKQVVQISPTSTNPGVTVDAQGQTRAYIFRSCFIDPFQGNLGANFAYQTLNATKAYLLYDGGCVYCQGLAAPFETAFGALGGTIAGKQTYPAGTSDFGAYLDDIIAKNPEVIYLPGFVGDINQITTQARAKNITQVFIGNDTWEDAGLNMTSTEGSFITTHFSAQNPQPLVQDFVARYKAKYSGATPDTLAALSYDAANLLVRGILAAGEDNPNKVKDALAGITFSGVSGQLTFDLHHNPIKPGVIMTINGGVFKFHTVVNP